MLPLVESGGRLAWRSVGGQSVGQSACYRGGMRCVSCALNVVFLFAGHALAAEPGPASAPAKAPAPAPAAATPVTPKTAGAAPPDQYYVEPGFDASEAGAPAPPESAAPGAPPNAPSADAAPLPPPGPPPPPPAGVTEIYEPPPPGFFPGDPGVRTVAAARAASPRAAHVTVARRSARLVRAVRQRVCARYSHRIRRREPEGGALA